MNRITVVLSLTFMLVAGLSVTGYVSATPSAGFREADGDVFDDWGVSRTRSFGEDGFYQLSETTLRPVIAFESLGEDTALAYSLGEQMAHQYSDQLQRAEAIFSFVQDKVQYTPDIDQFAYEEFAQNADELAAVIDQDGIGYGDCEDSAVLLAVMYKGAGYRSAIVVGPGHTAALVHLPGYDKASVVFVLEGESGWVWAEATARNNPLGWVPKELVNVELVASEVKMESAIRLEPPADKPPEANEANKAAASGETPESPAASPTEGTLHLGSLSLPFLFFGVMGLLWLLPLFIRRRTR